MQTKKIAATPMTIFFFCFGFLLSLHLASPSLTRAANILSPAGGLSPLDIVAELAALDGLGDHMKSVRALDQARGGYGYACFVVSYSLNHVRTG